MHNPSCPVIFNYPPDLPTCWPACLPGDHHSSCWNKSNPAGRIRKQNQLDLSLADPVSTTQALLAEGGLVVTWLVSHTGTESTPQWGDFPEVDA